MLRAVGTGLTAGVGGTLTQGYLDSSGTPGNVTNNGASGRAAVAAAASTCTVTNGTVSATSKVFVQNEGSDATATTLLHVAVAAGSFTVTYNAAATAATKFSFLVVN